MSGDADARVSLVVTVFVGELSKICFVSTPRQAAGFRRAFSFCSDLCLECDRGARWVGGAVCDPVDSGFSLGLVDL